MSRDYIGY